MDLWCRRQPLYQLSHNHCPKLIWVIATLFTYLFRNKGTKGYYNLIKLANNCWQNKKTGQGQWLWLIGRAFASNFRGQQFESSHRQNLFIKLFTIDCIEKMKKMRAEMAHFFNKKGHRWDSNLGSVKIFPDCKFMSKKRNNIFCYPACFPPIEKWILPLPSIVLCDQCTRMGCLFVNIWAFTTMNIFPKIINLGQSRFKIMLNTK